LDFLIVADTYLARLASRLMHVLRTSHDAENWSPETYARNQDAAKGIKTIFIGEFWEHGWVKEVPSPRGVQRLGVKWDIQGTNSVIWTIERERDGKAAYDALDRTIKRLEADALDLIESRPAYAVDGTGPRLMQHFLNHDFQVPAETVRGKVDFSMERLIWERRHLVGIASFLCEGFDDFS
jgi:hypothetical protein